ncbi:spermatogenesis associated 6-like protein [Acanthochromis polyacanthus]|uniref:spermatogenesis associated 6-like protein n=1 Tax=Acanthochromis polyacanthus TaxID=80966 RepID=UPI002234C8FD|nr:spermatogenesis associated 6-like protein [Acanthochromis polyacanthus]
MLEYETVGVELVQLIPPVGDTLACFEEDARTFLFPEPKLVPSFSGVDREVLMTRAPHFPGIAPRLEFSTKTTITECSPDAEINFYPNVPLRKVLKKNRRRSSRPRTTSPHQKQIQNLGRNRGGRVEGERRSIVRPSSHRSQSLSPLRTGNIQRLARLSLESTPSSTTSWNKSSNNQPMLPSWPGASRSASPQRSAVFTSSSSPLTRSSSTVRFSPTAQRKSVSNGVVGGTSEDDSSSSETLDPSDCHRSSDPSVLRRSYRETSRHSRSESSSHREWEEVHERVRGLLTTPKAVHRLVYGASVSEVDEVLARRSISPGPP